VFSVLRIAPIVKFKLRKSFLIAADTVFLAAALYFLNKYGWITELKTGLVYALALILGLFELFEKHKAMK
jgi:hypothetical protein